ncbi:MAG: K(+)-transporting ATPase subunit C [Parabacteroides sp.]|nr:K(+)-transporting ATPase subunit C [Parabacteroides sp.]
MKNLMKSIRVTLAFCVFFSICHILVLWVFAQFAASGEGGNAETVKLNGKVVGVTNVGQSFTKDIFFWGRPSCAGDGYDGTSSAGSNKGVANEKYLAEVEARIDTFMVHHPYLKRKDIPAEMVTASASGLDPNITHECAYIQIKRIADARGMSESEVKDIVDRMIERPLLGIFGPAKINVLKLNVAMEEANPTIYR